MSTVGAEADGFDGAVLELRLGVEDDNRTFVDVIEALLLSDVIERCPGVVVGASLVDVSESVENVWDVEVWVSVSVDES